jgi:hypothetical protein
VTLSRLHHRRQCHHHRLRPLSSRLNTAYRRPIFTPCILLQDLITFPNPLGAVSNGLAVGIRRAAFASRDSRRAHSGHLCYRLSSVFFDLAFHSLPHTLYIHILYFILSQCKVCALYIQVLCAHGLRFRATLCSFFFFATPLFFPPPLPLSLFVYSSIRPSGWHQMC